MIAASIMVIGLVLLFGSFFTVSETADISQSRAEAMACLSSVLEEMRGLNYEQLLAYQAPAFQNLPGNTVISVQAFGADGGAVALPVSRDALDEPLPNPCEVQATVVWSDRRGRRLTTRLSAMVGR